MDKTEIVYRTQTLGLPYDSFLVCGSAPLTIIELRDAVDIDLFVTPELFARLRQQGWQTQRKPSSNHDGLVYDIFEAHQQWQFGDYAADFTTERSKATIVETISFMNLSETRRWKLASGRPKDLTDIGLIDSYLAVSRVDTRRPTKE